MQLYQLFNLNLFTPTYLPWRFLAYDIDMIDYIWVNRLKLATSTF